jgi:hypothetical protein
VLEGTPPLLGAEIIAIAPRPPVERARRSVEQRQVVERGLLLQQLERRLPVGRGDPPAVLDGRRAVGIAEGVAHLHRGRTGGTREFRGGDRIDDHGVAALEEGEVGRSRTGNRTGPRGVKSRRRSTPGKAVWCGVANGSGRGRPLCAESHGHRTSGR